MVDDEHWDLIRPTADEAIGWRPFDRLIPEAHWFWGSLQRHCVPGCCGISAYDFSLDHVAWVCGWGTTPPDPSAWRSDEQHDLHELARALRATADGIRAIDSGAVDADLFNELFTPASYASLFDYLAEVVVPPSER